MERAKKEPEPTPHAPTRTVTLNIDLGELPDEPHALYSIATQVNVACGGHAGDAASMRRACEAAKASGAVVVAHPSYPDRAGFGRKTMSIDATALVATIAEQCAALVAIAHETGVIVRGAKAHGALYHDLMKSGEHARAYLDAVVEACAADARFMVVTPSDGALTEVARARGLGLVREGFADRGYAADGSLLPRGTVGALHEDPSIAAAQALRLAASGAFETICVHGDTPGAVSIARAVRTSLEEHRLLRTGTP